MGMTGTRGTAERPRADMIQSSAAREEIVEMALVGGDLARLTSQQRTSYYTRVCESIGVNPLTRPFEFITLNGKLVLYARKDCTDQLRRMNEVSTTIVSREFGKELLVVTVRASTPDGRCDESIGAVTILNLHGEALANAMMKAETKAKRRATLALCGLGFADESEIDGNPDARPVPIERNEPRPRALPPAEHEAAPAQQAPAAAEPGSDG